MKLKAYPKINLCLKVYKGFVDGKHKIDTVMYLYRKMHDTIKIKKSSDLFITYKVGQKQIIMNDCIIYKALKYLKAKYSIDINYRIKVNKKIPFGAGLGGGSSDAAAVINFILEQNPQIQLNLKEIAIELGSDIPFFLTNYPMARVKNLGESVSPIYNWEPKIKLTIPQIICSTTQVFFALEKDEEFMSKVNVDKIINSNLYKQHLNNVVYNDLTKYIIQSYKELQDVYKQFSSNSFFTGAGCAIVTIEG